MIQKKICMLGSFGVGKTSLIVRFVQGIFSAKYVSSVGVAISKRVVSVGDQQPLLMIWDLAGEESHAPVELSYLRGAAGYLLICDGTWPESLATAKSIHSRIVDQMGDMPFVLAINKADLRDKWEITQAEIAKLEAQGWKIKITSAKTGDGVEEMFETIAEETLRAAAPLSIFLCHASEDASQVRELQGRLERNGFRPWLDKDALLGGQDWAFEIAKAVRASDVVLVCLSQKSISKEGYVQKEIRQALNVADEKPQGQIFLIPLLLDDCSVPESLKKYQEIKLWEDEGYERLRGSLREARKNRSR